MKVCLVTSEFPPVVGGIANHVFELAKALIGLEVDVTVVHAVAPLTNPAADPFPGWRVVRPRILRAEPIYTVMLRHWLARFAARERFDLIHVHGVRPLGATRGLAAPVVFTNHSSGFLARRNAGEQRRRTAALLRHVAYLLAPSDELVEAARAFGYAGPAQMIANGVDTTKFAPDPAAASRNPPVIVLARRLVPKNGVIGFAKALTLLSDARFRVIVAGEGVEKAAMVETLRGGDVLERVAFLGSVPNDRMRAIYTGADIAVLPSLAEATSIAGLEAMACGLPLVGTNVGGIPTILKDGVTGLLVPPRDAEAMAAALRTLLGSPDLRRQYGDAGRRSVEVNFAWPMIARRTLEAYQACLSPSAGGRGA